MNKIFKYKFTFSYIVLILFIGLWSMLDWKFGVEDPLWHLVFYIIIIPALSLFFGILAIKEIKMQLIPLIVFASISIVWLVFENGGLTFSFDGLHIVTIPSIVASIGGVLINKLISIFKKKRNR